MVEEVLDTPTKTKKKIGKPEDFIGWKSEDGKLEVIGFAGKQGRNTLFKVTCTECSKDPELFPEGYFVSVKSSLVKGGKPCGCSTTPKWKAWQYLILTRRIGEKKGFIVHGFSGEFKGVKTKLNLECLKDGHKWTASIDNIINCGTGCPKCSGVYKPTEQEALQKCIDICTEMNYDVIGFPDGYKNAYSSFEYNCKIHGKQNVSYNNFVNQGRRCGGCWKDTGKLYGYYPERKDETDFLYVLNFNDKFIKVGRSFDVDERINNGLNRQSGIPNKKIKKLRIFSATHQEIYDYEQDLLNKLRPTFQYYCNWSTETLVSEGLPTLNDLLDNTCRFKEILSEGF